MLTGKKPGTGIPVDAIADVVGRRLLAMWRLTACCVGTTFRRRPIRKVCIVVNSRANYARIKSVMHAVRSHPDLALQLIVGASALLYRFGSAIDVVRSDGFEPVATCHMVIEGDTPATMAKSTGLGIVELTTIFEKLAPDIVLTVADRYETLATAVSASYMNIPLAHTQGGEVTGSIDESVRHAITKFAHIHFPATHLSRPNYLERMGEDPTRIFYDRLSQRWIC